MNWSKREHTHDNDTQNIPPKNLCNFKELIFISVFSAIILIIKHTQTSVTRLNVRSILEYLILFLYVSL